MATWSDFIQTGSYDGLSFDFVGTHDELGRVYDRQQIPGRDGVQLQDRARDGRVFDVLAIFIEDDYPDLMNRLIEKIDKGGVKEFVHPIYGKFKALVTRATVEHNADDSIDSATMQLHVEEHTDGQVGPQATRTTTAALANAARSAALAALNAATLFGAAVDALSNISANVLSTNAALVERAVSTANMASSAADSFEADGDTMSAIEVQAAANAVLTEASAVVSSISSCVFNGTTPLPEQFDMMESFTAMAGSLTDFAAAIAAGKPQLTTYIVDADIPLLAWVHAKYGDSSRTDEVLALNPWISDPMSLPAGSEVTAYAPQ